MTANLRYFALPTEPCPDVARDLRHMAHVHTPDGGTKSVCAGVLPHSVPTDDDEAAPGGPGRSETDEQAGGAA